MRIGTLAKLDLDVVARHLTVVCLHVQALGHVVLVDAKVIVVIIKSSNNLRL